MTGETIIWLHEAPPARVGGSDETEFEDADHDFQPFMQGWLLVPETKNLGLLEISEVDAANDLVITKGDAGA